MGVPVSGKELRETGLLGVPGGAHPMPWSGSTVCNVAYLSWYHRQFLEGAQMGGGESVAVQGTG